MSARCQDPFACARCSRRPRRRWKRRSAETGGLLAQAAAGPGLWEDLLGELRRAGLIAELLADGVITAAVAQAEHGHKLDRVLTAEVTAMCVIVGGLVP